MATILIVEDEAIVAEDLAGRLRAHGYEIAGISETGEEAVALVRSLQPSLVLMDVRLRGAMDGIEAAGIIWAECDVPVVYVTAHSDQATLERAKLTQPFGYVLKPFQNIALQSTVQMALYKHEFERKLRESEERYRSLFDGSLDAIFSLGADGRIAAANASAQRLAGRPLEELQASRFTDLCAPDRREAVSDAFCRAFRRQPVTVETVVIAAEGTRHELVVSYAPAIVRGAVVGVSCIAHEVTELRKAQDELVRRERLSSMGKLASSVAHELRSPLSVIGNAVHFLEQTPGPSREEMREPLAEVRRALARSNHIIHEMLDYVRESPRTLSRFPIADAISGALNVLRLPETIQIHNLAARAGEIQVFASRDQIERSLINLIQNAVEAMPQGGDLEIAATQDRHGQVCVSVRDTGCGILPENLGSIFEPLFSTKTRGIGLGLAIALRYARLNGGDLAVESEPGRGTTFRLTLKTPQ